MENPPLDKGIVSFLFAFREQDIHHLDFPFVSSGKEPRLDKASSHIYPEDQHWYNSENIFRNVDGVANL